MRAAMIAMLILLLPAALFAGPTMGVFFTYNPTQMHYYPAVGEEFEAYIFSQNAGCLLNAVEFKVQMPPYSGLSIDSYEFPDGMVSIFSETGGVSLAFFPPMDGSYPGYNLLCTLHLFSARTCECLGGTLNDAPVRIVAHPDTGHIRGSCFPENALFEFAGLTSIICPHLIGIEDKSWGAIKSLF